jgi:ATP-binding cassette subfamily C protein CydD
LLHIAGSVFGIGQAFAAASVLSAALAGSALDAAGLAFFAVLSVLRAAVSFLTERAAFTAGAAARRRLRSDAMSRLLHAGPALLRTSHSGDLATIVVDKIEALDGLFSRYVPAASFAILGPVLVLAAVLYADPWAALVLLGCGLLVPFGMALAGIGAAAASRNQFFAMARLQARFLDRIRGIATIVLYGRAEDEARSLAMAASELRVRTMRVLRVAFLSSVVLDLAAALAMVVLAIHYFGLLSQAAPAGPAAGAVAGGYLDVLWPALAVLLLTPEFFAPLRTFSAAYQDRLHATGAADSLINLPPLPEPVPPAKIRTVAAQGVTVAFDNVSLTWDATRGPALGGVSFRVAAGETLVLAGPSGSGKSSVIEILLGFIRPDSGRVTINGADISDLVPQALSRLTAWIGQRPVLFSGSIRDNILFARPEATPEEVKAAATSARLDQFTAGLPDGLDTRIGEGGYGLSGGQAQRVAVARAYLKNAPLLLLDEPTAHLDPATEQEVLDSLRRLALGRTVILASHSSAAHGFGGRRLDLRDGKVVSARGAA